MILEPAALPGLEGDEFVGADLGLAQLRLGADVRSALGDVVAGLRPSRIALLTDATPIASPDGDLKAWAHQVLEAIAPVDRVELPASTTADEVAVAHAVEGCAAADVVVTVGSGTMSDLGKVGANPRPHVIVQTAASVNGYSDDESVLLKSGVKRTTHTAYPTALLIDTEVLTLAPRELNRSGMGDMISMFTAPADWYLAHHLGMDPRWVPEAALLARRRGDEMLAAAEGIGRSDPKSLELLAELLTVSGLSMGLAGQTSPSSGMEHTVSHMLDMWAGARHTEHQLHGAQVGVTTLWASLLWERVVARLDAGTLPELQLPDEAEAERRVLAAFAEMDPSGRSGQECWADYRTKLQRAYEIDLPGHVAAFAADWATHRSFLDNCLTDPRRIAAALRVAEAPHRACDLAAPETTLWALTNNHLMRNRFNVCDLAFLTGLWDESVAAEIIKEADDLGA